MERDAPAPARRYDRVVAGRRRPRAKSSYYADVSLNRWMALTPPELVQGTLKLEQTVMRALRKGSAPVVPA